MGVFQYPRIQAIATISEDRLPVANTEKMFSVQRDHEYKRLGTLSLLAAIDLLTGEAIPLVSNTHKSSDFVRFLKILDEKYPKGDKIRLILDNHSAYTSRETQEYLNEVPVPYKWKYCLDTIELSEEDVGAIVYEVVNAKAVSPENQGKRAPKPRTHKSGNQTTTNA